MRPIITIIILRDNEAHYDTYDQSAEMSQVINIRLSQSNLNIEEKDQQDKDYQGKSLHWIGFSQSGPFDDQVWYIVSNEAKDGGRGTHTVS